MAVPRKRKKLDKTAETLKKKPARKRPAKPAARAGTKPATASNKKIDAAFQIMDHIEDHRNSPSRKSAARRSPATDERTAAPSPRKLGVRFHFSVDAVMPEPGPDDNTPADPTSNRSSLVDVGLTLPFIWKVPVIGGIAQKIARSLITIKK